MSNTDQVQNRLQELLHIGRALLKSMNTVMSTGAAKEGGDVWHYGSFANYARRYTDLVNAVVNLGIVDKTVLLVYDTDKLPSVGDTLAVQQKQIFHGVHANLSMLCAFLESKSGLAVTSNELTNLREFLSTCLRPAMLAGSPSMEKDVQDTLERLLIGRGMQKGIDYDRESGRVKHAGKESVPDFIFPSLSAALEVKLVKDRRSVPRVIEQMSADLVSYKTKYQHLLFLVYDDGGISDIGEFCRGFERDVGTSVIVVKD